MKVAAHTTADNGHTDHDAVNAILHEAADVEHEPELGKRFPNCESEKLPGNLPASNGKSPDRRDDVPHGAESMTFEVGLADDRGRRQVIVKDAGNEIHRDDLNINQAFGREKLLGALWSKTLLERQPYCPQGDNSEPSERAIKWLDAELLAGAARADNGEDAPAEPFPRFSAAELDAAEFELEYLVEGMLVAGQPCIVGGGKKEQKTNMLLDLAISLALGGHWLGRFKVNRACRVLFMSGESGEGTIQDRARVIAGKAGYPLANVGNFYYSPHLAQFGHVTDMRRLRKSLEQDECEVVCIDPAYLCMNTEGGERSIFAMGPLLRSVSELCQEVGATLILCHHCRKNIADPFEPPQLENIAFSGFQEFARQWLLTGRRSLYEPGSGWHELWLAAGGSAGHSSLWAVDIDEGPWQPGVSRKWDVAIHKPEEARQAVAGQQDAAKEAKKQQQLERDKKSILAAVAKLPGHKGTMTDIRARAGRNGQAFQVAFAELVDASDLVGVEITKANKRTYEGFALGGDA